LTQEHIISQWISDDLKTIPRVADVGFLQEFGQPGAARSFFADRAEMAPRVVCETCNPGWMNDLEIAMQGILPPMFRGYRTRLSFRKQQLITSWAMMKFMAAEYLAPGADPKYFTQEEREEFRKSLRPPSGVFMWLAMSVGRKVGWSLGRGLPWPEGGYVAVYGAGAFLVLFIAHRGQPNLAVRTFIQEFVFPLWPFQQIGKWPPPETGFDDASILHFFENVPAMPPELLPPPTP
jgi:hypothetical protein